MVHFSCDLCGKDITASGEDRYTVAMEVRPGFDPDAIREGDLDDDPMESVADLARRAETSADADSSDDAHRGSFRFDLCSDCRRRFVRDPLGKSNAVQFDFSKN